MCTNSVCKTILHSEDKQAYGQITGNASRRLFVLVKTEARISESLQRRSIDAEHTAPGDAKIRCAMTASRTH